MSTPKVFVSYTHDSSEHKAWVRSLARRLERTGADVWVDEANLMPGEPWKDALTRALKEADVALVVLTGRERSSAFALRELEILTERARNDEVKLIPIVRGGDAQDVPFELREWHWIDMRDDDAFLAEFARLRRAVFHTVESDEIDIDLDRRLSRLRLQNVKLFEDLELDLTDDDGKPRGWTCILADNGCGKTTILQAIALAASGDVLATKLTDDARSFAPVHAPDTRVSIEADFVGGVTDTLRTRLELDPGSHDWSGVGSHDHGLRALRSARQSGFFVAGYGAGRRLSRAGQVAVPADPVLARVRSVFDNNYPLLGLEFGEALHQESQRRAFLRSVNELLRYTSPDGESLLPGVRGVAIAEHSVPGAVAGDVVVDLDLGAGPFQLGPAVLSSGYQSVLVWIGELLGQFTLSSNASNDHMRGIVLIDELDQHLHPTWQRRMVPALRTLFPQVQFIVTTHSPLVLTGFAASEIVAIELESGRLTKREEPLPEPGLQSGSQLYSSFFETPTAARPGLEEKEREVMSLQARSASLEDHEAARLLELRRELEPFWRTPFRDPAAEVDTPNGDQLRSILKDLEAS